MYQDAGKENDKPASSEVDFANQFGGLDTDKAMMLRYMTQVAEAQAKAAGERDIAL